MREYVVNSKVFSVKAGFSVFLFAALMAVSSFIRVPLFFTPVPVTLQTAVLFFAIAALKKKASISQAIYIMLGASGLSVFGNGGAGIAYLFGPTGGYLIGFVVASLVIGNLTDKFLKIENRFFAYSLMFSAVSLIVYSCGVSWLKFSLNLSLSEAFILGVTPFVSACVIKIILTAALAAKLIRE